jgi:hypothetical protein
MAFDSGRARTVLVGGANTLSFASTFRETWELSGGGPGMGPPRWELRTLPAPVPHPSTRCDNAVAYDAARGVTVSFGGFNGAFLGDTWEWNGTDWSLRSPPPPVPGARADSFMVYDGARSVMVLFGGLAPANIVLGDTWEYDGAAWTNRQLAPPAAPSPRWIHRMAYDTQRARIVLFGGASPGAVLGDTWEFDGQAWTQVATAPPPGAPSARYGHAMAYDSDRHVTLLFGGQTGFNFGVGVLGDTWEFDGAGWVARPGAVGGASPPARSFSKLAYDSARRRAVLFGGYDGSAFINDTWEFSAFLPTGTPAARWTARISLTSWRTSSRCRRAPTSTMTGLRTPRISSTSSRRSSTVAHELMVPHDQRR